MTTFFDRLEREQETLWFEIHNAPFWQHLRRYGLDEDLYVRVMTEIFHFTRHNSQNQALAALKLSSERLKLLKYCLHHAYEEAGHDLMVLEDLREVGVAPEQVVRSTPLPETQGFIAYLYRTAAEADATARLGYSYWAEGSYSYIKEFTDAMRRDLGLTDKQMTFFVDHSTIDTAHLEAVRKVLREHCTSPALEAGVVECLRTSLRLSGQMLEGVYREYMRARAGFAA
ncbi:MAG TPA: iron-containing redox enzyme family protein [Polyangiaceae bacterium]